MIVDLMRNDLARVSPPGSVKAPELFKVETFANVHHLVSTVTARLARGLGVADLLRASFPPGSITGAPKVQAMKVIAELEPPRGPYCGSLFWAGFDGALRFQRADPHRRPGAGRRRLGPGGAGGGGHRRRQRSPRRTPGNRGQDRRAQAALTEKTG
jgi:hypothetical protein